MVERTTVVRLCLLGAWLLLAPGTLGCGDDAGDGGPGAAGESGDAVGDGDGDGDGRDAGPTADAGDGAGATPDGWPELPAVDAGAAEYRCEIGIADPTTNIDLRPLSPGGPIPIGGLGQTGLTAKLGIRLTHPQEPVALEAAIIDLLLTNVDSGVTGESRAWGEPVRLFCDADGSGCERTPIEVEISHLAKLPELEGLRVQVDVTVRDADDVQRILAVARTAGVLERL